MERYEKFKARHRRFAFGVAVGGGCLAVIGLAGVPSDLENWSAFFQSIGSNLGRWVLVVIGLVVIGVAVLPWKGKPGTTGPTPEETAPTQPLTHGDLIGTRVPVAEPPETGVSIGAGRERLTGAGLRAAVERRARTDIEDEFVAMIDEGRTLQGDEYGGTQPAWGEYIAWREGVAEFVDSALGPTERQRLLEVPVEGSQTRDHVGTVMNWLRVRRDHPDSWEPHANGEVLATAIEARRLRGDVPESGTSPALASTLDNVIREGMDLRHELEAPVEPEESSPGNWSIVGGVPEGWWEKVDAFDQRIRDLLRAERPALLGTYAECHNAAARQLRETNAGREPRDHKADSRSDAQKALAFANATREGPMLRMDCILDGLSAARRQFGLEHH